MPLCGQAAQGRAHRLRGKIGLGAFAPEHEETAVLHDQLETLHPLIGAPADPQVAVFERITGRTPNQQCGGLPAHKNDLAQIIAHRTARAQIVVLAQLRIEPTNVCGTYQAHRDRFSFVFQRWRHRVHPSQPI
jgi:hypothetical protein